MDLKEIQDKLKRAPQKPGVYLLKDAKGKILYAGKAKVLRARLRQHFNPGKDEEPRHHLMMSKVHDFETVITDSEVEALIMESNYVKEHRPKYNVNLKDDKSFPYIRVTAEPYPRIFITRTVVHDGSKYFGPFTDVLILKRLMAAIRRIFPIRPCKLHITQNTIRTKKHSVCLMYHIGRCPGPCEGYISESDYGHMVEQVASFIRGKNKRLVKELEIQMKEFAAIRDYEQAAHVRDQIRYVENFQRKQKVMEVKDSDRDIMVIASEDCVACGLVFHIRDGKLINRMHYVLNGTENQSASEIMRAFLQQYYIKAEFIPKEILLSASIAETDDLIAFLEDKRKGKVVLQVPQKGEKARLMEMCKKNAQLLLDELCLQKEQQDQRIAGPVEALQKDLGLDHPPHRIEAFDNSNIQGTDPVASLVVFENGKPKKSEYRKYKIKTVHGADDFASMAEVVERRITRLLKEGKEMPDLFLVDGGKGQLSAAVDVLQKFQMEDQPIIGLAKRLEEIFRPGISDPQTLPKSSPSLHLLQQVRDEAHRFAITFHRSLRKKRTVHSELDDIKGIGEKRRKALLKTFGSVESIRKASVDELAGVGGMNRKAAEDILKYLSGKKIDYSKELCTLSHARKH